MYWEHVFLEHVVDQICCAMCEGLKDVCNSGSPSAQKPMACSIVVLNDVRGQCAMYCMVLLATEY